MGQWWASATAPLVALVVLLVVSLLDVVVVSSLLPALPFHTYLLREVAASFLLLWGWQGIVLGANGRFGENGSALDSSQVEYGSTFVHTLS
jgi:hypothetical protein